MNKNTTDTGPEPERAGKEGEERGGDEAEATGRAAEIERLAGRSWMALEAGEVALRAASALPRSSGRRERERRLAGERAETIDQLHRLADDLHTDSPLLHWLDAPTATRRLLGLPNGVNACVFDLDSVLTTSTTVHIAAWADTFDSFLLARAGRQRERFVPFDRDGDYEPIWRNGRGLTASAPSWPAAASGFPRAAPTTVPTARPCTASPSGRRQALQHHLAREGVAAYIGSRCYLEAAHLVGIGRAVVSASANTTEILERAGLAHLIDQRIDAERSTPSNWHPNRRRIRSSRPAECSASTGRDSRLRDHSGWDTRRAARPDSGWSSQSSGRGPSTRSTLPSPTWSSTTWHNCSSATARRAGATGCLTHLPMPASECEWTCNRQRIGHLGAAADRLRGGLALEVRPTGGRRRSASPCRRTAAAVAHAPFGRVDQASRALPAGDGRSAVRLNRRLRAFLPVCPLDASGGDVAPNCGSEGREEPVGAEPVEHAVLPQAVANVALELGESELDAVLGKLTIEVLEHLGGGDVDVRDRLRCDDHP